MNKAHYITTSIPYVNARPHIGHALELVQAVALARYHRLLGDPTVFQTGTDENAHKNVSAAQNQGVSVRELVDSNAAAFQDLVDALCVVPNSFIRTTEERHELGVKQLWSALKPSDIYTQPYKGLYCQGCEDFVNDRDLVDGQCIEHLLAPSVVEETNYFFRLSRYQDALAKLITSDRLRIYPEQRKREVLSFVKGGLRDISISRDSNRMSDWGITVPGDDSQVTYVWIDALINYITGVGYGSGDAWEQTWNPETHKVHVIGKNVWKFHTVYWPALLLSAGLPLPDHVVVHGFLTAEGKKISKSLGNTVDPMAEINEWGSEAVRLYLLSFGTFADGDYSVRTLRECYNSQLATRLGSTVTRVAALCQQNGLQEVQSGDSREAPIRYHKEMAGYRFDKAIDALLECADKVNSEIAEVRPWEGDAGRAEVMARLRDWAERMHSVGYWLQPFMPVTGAEVCSIMEHSPITKPEALFPRLSNS